MKVLAGNLSATFNIDGQHLDRYLKRRNTVVATLCDQLLLHDQILIPTQDYFTAAGLVTIIGEKNLISLLEEEKVRFVRLRGFFGYARGTSVDGRLVAMNDPSGGKAVSAPIDQSIEIGLNEISGKLTERKKLAELLATRSTAIELAAAVDATHRSAYADLAQTALWKNEYVHENPELLALPGVDQMGVRVIGPGIDVSKNVIDACLALGLVNIEHYLAKEFACTSTATG